MHRLEKNILHHANKKREQRKAKLKEWKEYYEQGSKEDYENGLIFDIKDTKWSSKEVMDKLKKDNIIN